MQKSCVQVYTGDGKGKTTAAMGLAMRAAGRGLCVKIVQFLKGRDTGELSVLRGMAGVELVRAAGCPKFFHELPDEEKARLREDVLGVLATVDQWLGKADVLILDEAMGSLTCGILKLDEVLRIIDRRGGTEVVLTGRDAPEAVLERADLITEMREVRHYIKAGVKARRGIEY